MTWFFYLILVLWTLVGFISINEGTRFIMLLIPPLVISSGIMTLLKDEKIYIIGYDFDVYEGVKRIQSIRPEGVIFGKLKKDFVEIDNLIKQLESPDVDEVKESSYKLKRLFRRKLESVKNEELSSLIEEDVDSLFNRTLYYINTQKEEQKRILKNKFAWSVHPIQSLRL